MSQDTLFNLEEFTQREKRQENPFPPGYFKGKDRPARDLREARLMAAERIIDEILEWMDETPDEDDLEEFRDDLREELMGSFHQTGFGIAKDLSDSFNVDIGEPDSRLVEILEGLDSEADDFQRKAVQRWIEDNGVTPKLQPGTAVKVKVRRNIVDGVIEAPSDWGTRYGTYTVAVPSEGQKPGSGCGYVLPWGEVEEMNAPNQAAEA